jgi:carbonic anhydrase/acetyltransferase-like protein (isoleucine patch superfamily)
VKQGHKVPESVVVAGNPARKIRDMSQNDIDFWNKARRIYVDLAA